MFPSIPDNSTILYINVSSKEDLYIGDIVYVKRDDGTFLLHRIIDITDEGYKTKGDNNIFSDWEVWKLEQIQGKVIGVLY
jgi:signal peptidase I